MAHGLSNEQKANRKSAFAMLEKVLDLLGWDFSTLDDEEEKTSPNGLFIGNETFFKKLESDDT